MPEENNESQERMVFHTEHRKLEILLKWALGLISIAIIGAFTWAFNMDTRVTRIEEASLANTHHIETLIAAEHKVFERRINMLEEELSNCRPRITAMQQDIRYMTLMLEELKESRVK